MTMLPKDNDLNPIQALGVNTEQTPISVGATAAQSAAFGSSTIVIRVVANTDCHIAFGSNPTATANSTFIPKGLPEYFKVNSGEKLSVIQDSAAGTLYITEME